MGPMSQGQADADLRHRRAAALRVAQMIGFDALSSWIAPAQMAAESAVNCCLLNFRTARGAGRLGLTSAFPSALALLIAAPAGADPPARTSGPVPAKTSAPLHIPAPGGEVILPDVHAQ